MTCTYITHSFAQITLFVEVENLKRAFRLICCCNQRKALNDDHQVDNTGVDTTPPCATRDVALSHVTVTPHSRLKTLSYVVGVDDIDALVSDFEQHLVGSILPLL